jgi:hypothetical protein
LHLAHVLQMAVRQTQEHRTLARYPECMIFEHRQQAVRQSMMKAGAGLGGVIAAASAAVWLTRGRTNNLHRAA